MNSFSYDTRKHVSSRRDQGDEEAKPHGGDDGEVSETDDDDSSTTTEELSFSSLEDFSEFCESVEDNDNSDFDAMLSFEEEEDYNSDDYAFAIGRRIRPAADAATASKRGVRFSTIQIREYRITLGDHPCANENGGYPLSLDWDYHWSPSAGEIDLDTYEKYRRRCRDRGASFHLNAMERCTLLTQAARVHPIELMEMERRRLEHLAEEYAAAPQHEDERDSSTVGLDITGDDGDSDDDEAPSSSSRSSLCCCCRVQKQDAGFASWREHVSAAPLSGDAWSLVGS